MSSNAAQFGWCTAGRIINWHYRNRKFSLAGRDIFFYFGWHGVDSYPRLQNSAERIRIQPLFERTQSWIAFHRQRFIDPVRCDHGDADKFSRRDLWWSLAAGLRQGGLRQSVGSRAAH